MRAALGLAARGLGNVWPNPAVGCLIARDGRLVGRGWTRPGGRPHAERVALDAAGAAARGATAYVTFEPCAHHGETPPCADALLAAGVARVVVATTDPDPRVDGRGLARLRDAGIAVDEGCCRDDAAALNAGFLCRQVEGRPLVSLKLATSLDGKIATRTGQSQWITGAAARARGHLLRARHDAVMVGSGTALADDPALTCRLPGWRGRQPVRVVADARLRLAPGSKLVAGIPEAPLWVLAARGADGRVLADAGAELLELPAGPAGGVDLPAALAALAGRGLTRLLVEGGAGLASALLRAGLVDRLYWFRAPGIIGDDGLAGIGPLQQDSLAGIAGLHRLGVEAVGQDLLESYARRTV